MGAGVKVDMRTHDKDMSHTYPLVRDLVVGEIHTRAGPDGVDPANRTRPAPPNLISHAEEMVDDSRGDEMVDTVDQRPGCEHVVAPVLAPEGAALLQLVCNPLKCTEGRVLDGARMEVGHRDK